MGFFVLLRLIDIQVRAGLSEIELLLSCGEYIEESEEIGIGDSAEAQFRDSSRRQRERRRVAVLVLPWLYDQRK